MRGQVIAQSGPRFSSLRNSCTHLQDTGLPERFGQDGVPASGHSKGPQGPSLRKTATSPLPPDPVTPREDARTRTGPRAQLRLKRPAKGGAGERRQGSCSGLPILEDPQARPGVGMGRIVRGPRSSPVGRALSLPNPHRRNPSPHSPNVDLVLRISNSGAPAWTPELLHLLNWEPKQEESW